MFTSDRGGCCLQPSTLLVTGTGTHRLRVAVMTTNLMHVGRIPAAAWRALLATAMLPTLCITPHEKVRVLHRTGVSLLYDLGIGNAALRSLLANAIEPLSPFCS